MQNSTEENQKDWYKASMIFAKALGIILEEEQGIIVDLDDTLSIPGIDGIDGINKVIIFRKENQVHIAPCEDDIPQGSTVTLGPPPSDELTDVE
jgi:hypothetical protein